MKPQLIRFETNLDELVDANERYWKRAKAGQSQRRRGVVGVAAAFTVSLFLAAFVSNGAQADLAMPLAAVALVLGVVFWPLYGRLYDRGLKRRLRRVLTEQAGDETSWLCEIELRKEGVWSRSRGMEFLFDWQELILLQDSDDAIEFHFRGGFVMARNRAFSEPPERVAFLESARRLAAR